MAETTEKNILIEVDLKIDDSINRIGKLREEVKKLEQKIEIETDPKQLELYNQTLKATNKELRAVENVTQKAIQANDLNNHSIGKARLALSVVTAQWVKTTQIYGENSKATKELAKLKDELTEAIKREERATGEHGRNVGNYPFESIKAGWMSVAAGITGTFIAIKGVISAFTDSFNTIKEFQTASNELSAITGQVGSNLVALENAAIEMSTSVDESGNKINKSATEILQAFQKVGSAKPELLENAEALKEVTKNAIILSQAGGRELPLDAAVKALTQTMNQFGASAEESTRYINVLAAGAKFGAAEIPYLNEALIKVGVTASNAGLTIEQTAAALEVFGEKGMTAETAGTGFKTLLIKLQQDSRNFKDGVFDLNLAIKNNAEISDNAVVIAKKYGLEQVNVAQILFKNSERLNKLTADMTGTNTAFEQSKVNTKGLAFEMQTLGNKWDAFVLSIDRGEGFIGKAVSGFTSLASSILGVVTPTNTLVESMAKEKVEMNLLVAEITKLNVNNSERDKLISDLKEKYPEFINLIGKDTESNEDLAKALELVNEQYTKKIELQLNKGTLQVEKDKLDILKENLTRQETLQRVLKNGLEESQKGNKIQEEAYRKQYQSLVEIGQVQFDTGFDVRRSNAAFKAITDRINELNTQIKNQNAVVAAASKATNQTELDNYYNKIVKFKALETETNEYKKTMMKAFVEAYNAGNMDLAAADKRYIDNYKEAVVKTKKETSDVLTSINTKEAKKAAEDAAKAAKEDLERKIKNLDYAIDLEKRKNKGSLKENELYNQQIYEQERQRIIDLNVFYQLKIGEKMEIDKENFAKYKHESEVAEIETSNRLAELDINFKSESLQREEEYNAEILKSKETLAEMEEAILNAKYETAQNIGNALVETSKALFGEQNEITKAAGLVQIAIDTTVGAMKAWTSAQSLPAPFNIIAGAAAVAATVAMGVQQTNKLLSINEGSTATSSGGSTPNMPAVTNNAPQSIGYQNPKVNSGIIANNTVIDKSSITQTTQTAVVVDEVTAKQHKRLQQEKMGTI
jgi:TP901 family phage tail tape measure protein